MKIKKFENLWTMGLILCIGILVVVYLAKLIFPEWVVGVAETPSIVNFGVYVDTHKWAYYLFYFITSMFIMYLYCGACCKKVRLSYFDISAIAFFTILSYPIESFLPALSFAYNNVLYIVLPFIIYMKSKAENVYISTCTTFIITSFAQALSLEIRRISTMITYPNTATYLILIIDASIWNLLLYLYFNQERRKKDG